ncbi:MAG TPA: flagellar protein FliS [Gemmataceae bacterium]|nr:flagellar protein FliS [Gemmataceae bacterium]
MSVKQYEACQNQGSECLPRIELLLTLFDATMQKLEEARAALLRNDPAAQPLVRRAQRLVGGLAAGVIPNSGEVADNCLRLYQFALDRLTSGTLAAVEDSLRVLRPLHEGFQGIRDEAVQLERAGQIPVVSSSAFEATV